ITPRGITLYGNWVLTNDFSQWSAILYAPDGGENYFDASSKVESPSGLTLMPMDRVDAHFYALGPENPAGVPSAGKIGLRLVHPDGSQDIYGSVSGLQATWGFLKQHGRYYDSPTRPADLAVYNSSWAGNVPAPAPNPGNTPPGTSLPVQYLAGDALLT